MEKLRCGGWGEMHLRWSSRTVAALCEAPSATSSRSGSLNNELSESQTPQLPFRKQTKHRNTNPECGRHIF